MKQKFWGWVIVLALCALIFGAIMSGCDSAMGKSATDKYHVIIYSVDGTEILEEGGASSVYFYHGTVEVKWVDGGVVLYQHMRVRCERISE